MHQYAALTQLNSSIPGVEACIGEDVIFICSTSSYNLRWTVRLLSSTILPKVVAFRSSDTPGVPIHTNENGLQLRFELTSFVANPINLTSTLIAYASEVLDYASIECAASSSETLIFRILSREYACAQLHALQAAVIESSLVLIFAWNLGWPARYL